MFIYFKNDRLRTDKIEAETVLESFLKNNSEGARTLLSSGITTNHKAFNDKDLLFIYNLKMLTKENHCPYEEKVTICVN